MERRKNKDSVVAKKNKRGFGRQAIAYPCINTNFRTIYALEKAPFFGNLDSMLLLFIEYLFLVLEIVSTV